MKKNNCTVDNRLSPHFEEILQKVREEFFSRNPKYWPVFKDKSLESIINHREKSIKSHKKHHSHEEKIFNDFLLYNDEFPFFSAKSFENDRFLQYVAATSKLWEDPASVENVVTMSSDPAIFGCMIGALVNPNLAYASYAGSTELLEKLMIRQMSKLIGYDPEQATGVFTQGGTFCNMYGYLLGMRKSIPNSKLYGMHNSLSTYHMINSIAAHYSAITTLSVLGIDIAKRVLRIKVTHNHDIDIEDFEEKLHACFSLKSVVPTILLTLGTTDTFGVDQVKSIMEIRDALCDKFEINIKPHIHADAAVGWNILFFLNYDFDANPLNINFKTLTGLRKNVERFKQIKYADSITIDFHKWGYTPYPSSLILIKNKDDLNALKNDPENFSYFEKGLQGKTHLQSTIECSRGALGLFGAFTCLNQMGIENLQIITANCLQNANYFREKLHQLGFVKLISPENQGPSVGFRLYNPKKQLNPLHEFEKEINFTEDTSEYISTLEQNNKWHRQIFLSRKKVGLYTSWVEEIDCSNFNENYKYHRIAGEKAVFLNPLTTRKNIDEYIESLLTAVNES